MKHRLTRKANCFVKNSLGILIYPLVNSGSSLIFASHLIFWRKSNRTISILALCATSLAACVSSQPTLPIETFALPASTAPTSTVTSNAILFVSPANIAPQFSNFSFMYRISDTQYLTDPYRQFLSAPNIQISNYLQNQLSRSVNATVIGPNSLLTANVVLQENINALYADYRDKIAPVAVLDITFTLYQLNNGKAVQVGTLALRENTPVAPNDPNALLQGYQKDLDKMLPKLSGFLRKQLTSEINSQKIAKS